MPFCPHCENETSEGSRPFPESEQRLTGYTTEETQKYINDLQDSITEEQESERQRKRKEDEDRRQETKEWMKKRLRIAVMIMAGVLIGVSVGVCATPGTREPPVAPVDTSPEMQAGRADLIERLISEGIFYKVENPATYPRVWVTSLFYSLDYDDKEAFIKVVWAYYISEDPTCDIVILRDSKSGERVGEFTLRRGLRLTGP